VLNPWNIDALREIEQESGKRIYNILQLRLHPAIIELKNRITEVINGKKHEINLTYIKSRVTGILCPGKRRAEIRWHNTTLVFTSSIC
jgi:predicted dehydrogenase